MTYNVMIIKEGVCAFHRAYGEMTFTDIHLVGGFFHALITFSTQLGEGQLDSIKYSNLNIYFKPFKGFTFVLGVQEDVSITKEKIELILNTLAEKFHEQFPSAAGWDGNTSAFNEFFKLCDEILQSEPSRKGFPLLLKITFKPFLIGPASQILFIDPEKQKYFYELNRRLERFSEKLGHKDLKNLIQEPSMLYLPNAKYLVYINAFSYKKKKGDITHLLCFIFEEEDWFMFYQLGSIIHRKTMEILPTITQYLKQYEKNPDSNEVAVEAPKVQDLVETWADLNQYLGSIQASLIEEFYKSGIATDSLNEEQTRSRLADLISRLGEDLDKLIFAILTQKQILFVGESKKLVEQLLSALVSFYPHPSVVLWTEEPTDYLLVGTHPLYINKFKKDALIVNLMENRIIGGEKNEFCSDLIKKTIQLAEYSSLDEAQVFFQGKIANLFALLRRLMDIIVVDDDTRSAKKLTTLLGNYPTSTLDLLAKMSSGLNMILAKNIKQFLKVDKLAEFMGVKK